MARSIYSELKFWFKSGTLKGKTMHDKLMYAPMILNEIPHTVFLKLLVAKYRQFEPSNQDLRCRNIHPNDDKQN